MTANKTNTAVRTRNIASNNLVMLKQSELVNFAKLHNDETIEKAAYNSGNRQTVIHVEYQAFNEYDGDANMTVVLVPTVIQWHYEYDALNQAERIELANMRKFVTPIETLFDNSVIDAEQKDTMVKSLIDFEKYLDLVTRENQKGIKNAYWTFTGDYEQAIAYIQSQQ